VRIVFLEDCGQYHRGQTVTLGDVAARALVEKGVAVPMPGDPHQEQLSTATRRATERSVTRPPRS